MFICHNMGSLNVFYCVILIQISKNSPGLHVCAADSSTVYER